jgi:small conductance mechanosensitive channel
MSKKFPSRCGRVAAMVLAVVGFVCALAPAVAQDQPEASALEPQAQALLDAVDQARKRIAALDARLESAEGEQAQLLERRLGRERLKGFHDIQALASNVLKQEADGRDASELRTQVIPLMKGIRAAADRVVQHRKDTIARLSIQRDQASPAERPIVERRLDNEYVRLDQIYGIYLGHITNMEALGLEANAERSDIAERLLERAENLAVRIELADEQKSDFEARLSDLPGDADLTAELRAVRDKLAGSIRSLGVAVDLMGQLEIDTTEHAELLIEATGHLTTDVLDAGVVVSLVRNWIRGTGNWISANGPGMVFKLILLLVILFVFNILGRLAGEITRKAIGASKLNFTQLLSEMVVSMTGNAVRALGLLVALSQLGISLGPLLAGLGIAGFVLGFALQDSLANFAAGLMILLYRPYDVGDLIEAGGVFGTVNQMSLVSTTFLTLDHQTLIVPNGKIWGDVIKNVTAQNERRVDMVFGIGYSDDIPHAETVLNSILKSHDKVLDEPEPVVRLHELADSSVNFIVRPWVQTDDYWDVYWDITREVKMRFDREGVSIPFPQRDVHVYREQPDGDAVAPPNSD